MTVEEGLVPEAPDALVFGNDHRDGIAPRTDR